MITNLSLIIFVSMVAVTTPISSVWAGVADLQGTAEGVSMPSKLDACTIAKDAALSDARNALSLESEKYGHGPKKSTLDVKSCSCEPNTGGMQWKCTVDWKTDTSW